MLVGAEDVQFFGTVRYAESTGQNETQKAGGTQTSDESIVFAEEGVQATYIYQRPERRSAICVQRAKRNVIVESGINNASIKSVF